VRTLYFLIFITLAEPLRVCGTRVSVSALRHPPAGDAVHGRGIDGPVRLAADVVRREHGTLTDRIGWRGPCLVGSVAIAAGAILPFLWQNLLSLYPTSVLIGSGFMMYQVAAQHILGYIGRPEDRPMNFSLSALGFSVSGFIGPMIAGFGIDAFGHVATFAALAAFPLVPIAVLGLNKLHLPRPHAHAPPPDPGRSRNRSPAPPRAAPCFCRERAPGRGVGHVLPLRFRSTARASGCRRRASAWCSARFPRRPSSSGASACDIAAADRVASLTVSLATAAAAFLLVSAA